MASSVGGIISSIVPVQRADIATDFTSIAALFDSFKVTYCQVQYFPTYVNNPLSAVGTFHPIYVSYDPDSNTHVGTVDGILQYDNRRIFNLYRPWTYKTKVRVQTDNSVANSGMQSNYRPGLGLMLDAAQVANYNKGIIQWEADLVPASTQFGDIVVTLWLTVTDRR